MNKNQIRKKEIHIISLFLFFPLILLILFGVLPIINLVYYSFTSWNGISSVKEFVGIDNYITIITDPRYLDVFKSNFYYFISGLLQIILALYFAIIIFNKVKFEKFFKVTFIIPMMISGVAISMIFRLFFEPEGVLDSILKVIGLEEYIKFYLGDPSIVNITLGFISLWRKTCVSFVIYYGAMQTIPKELFKIAEIEGASLIQKVRYIIIPGINTVLKINFILLIIGSISVFEIPMIMTNGANGTTTFLLQTMKTAFENKMLGLAAAMGVVITIVIIFLTLIQRKLNGVNKNEY